MRIVEFIEGHENHELIEENFRVLPEKRKLDRDNVERAKLLLKGGVKPSIVRSLLRDMNSGEITAKDLSNLRLVFFRLFQMSVILLNQLNFMSLFLQEQMEITRKW